MEVISNHLTDRKQIENAHKHTLSLTHQGIKHQDVIVICLRMLHHNVEQGVQSVLQELHAYETQGSSGETTHGSAYTPLHLHH